MIRQIKKQAPVFVAILFLFVIALGIGGYILSNQRFYLPAWVPVVGTEFYTVKAELPTAQAVVPGQGQTVNIAGVKIGEVGSVEPRGGQGRRRPPDQGRVQADLPRRLGPAAPQDRPEGHVPGARPGQQARRASCRRAAACAWRTRSPT